MRSPARPQMALGHSVTYLLQLVIGTLLGASLVLTAAYMGEPHLKLLVGMMQCVFGS